nr:hypothetical protein [Mycolicibacterium komanii]
MTQRPIGTQGRSSLYAALLFRDEEQHQQAEVRGFGKTGAAERPPCAPVGLSTCAPEIYPNGHAPVSRATGGGGPS